jgi:hypothetical protein
VAVAGVATANDNAVCAPLESAEHEHGVNAAGARNSDDLYVCRVVKTVIAGKVSARVRAPVAAKRNYQGFIFFYLHIASTSAII